MQKITLFPERKSYSVTYLNTSNGITFTFRIFSYVYALFSYAGTYSPRVSINQFSHTFITQSMRFRSAWRVSFTVGFGSPDSWSQLANRVSAAVATSESEACSRTR